MNIDIDTLTASMLGEWLKHQDTKPAYVDETAPQFAINQMNAWTALDDAWRLLVGTRLARTALDTVRNGGVER